MLKIQDLHVFYGGIHALQGISLEVPKGKIVSLIGANGAGKSTTLNTIAGLVKAKSGSISWCNEELTKIETKEIVKKGVVLVPEGRRIFPNLSTLENITLGAYHRKDKAEIARDKELVFELFPRLKERAKQNAGTLSGGEQQMLAVARGLMAKPAFFMLDEPSLGLAPLIVKDIFDTILKINKEGVTVLLVEQNARAALRIADFAYVMETSRIAFSGTGTELLANPKIKEAYLGSQ